MKRRHFLAGALALTASPALAQIAPGAVRIKLATDQGDIVLDLYADKAPITAANFLRYVDRRLLDHSTFYRASKAPGAPEIGVIQGGLRNDVKRVLKPIAHESTTKTGLKHKDGTISMARNAPGSATSDFFICLGDAAYLDADPTAPGDNLGFAAFGQVVEGMDVVRKIHDLPTNPNGGPPGMKGEMLKPPIPILTARRVKAA